MRKIALTLAAMSLSATAFADITNISQGNDDLYGWAVEDRQLRAAKEQMTYQAPVLPFNAPDQYGGILFNEGPGSTDAGVAEGVGDSYGSVLHSVGFSW